ncbi:taste receptor type 2 member 9-like [Eleutherodactylus coqui]|uniref:taste receptor type 2 member 9-like n=1 Tax=Eleutherodactylus coqui TaxID=57060 RepID=UPI00346201C6
MWYTCCWLLTESLRLLIKELGPEYKMLPETFAFSFISCLLLIIGLLLNGFIVIINFFWWIKHQTLQTINVIITSLGLVRIALLGIFAQFIYIAISDISMLHIDAYPETIGTLTVCLMFCSLWWASVLCVFYCVKITNYSNTFFMRLKMKISTMIPWLLLISLVISFISSLPYIRFIYYLPIVNGTNDGIMKVNLVNMFIIISTGSVIPFVLCCMAIYLTVVSLLRHTRNMNSRDSGFSDAQRDIHLSVIRNMVSLLLLYALYFVTYVMIPIFIELKYNLSVSFIFLCAFPNLHSASLIVSNKELKKSFLVVFSCTWLLHIKQ